MNPENHKSLQGTILYVKKRWDVLLLFSMLAIALGFFTCTPYNKVAASYDNNTDFSVYHSYKWSPDRYDPVYKQYSSEIVRNNARNYVDEALAERGFVKSDNAPDLLLTLEISNKEGREIVSRTYQSGPYSYPGYYYSAPPFYSWRYHYYYNNNYYFGSYPQYYFQQEAVTEQVEYVENAITLNVADRKQNKMIWSATSRQDIYDPYYINESIYPAVKGIMKKFPVKPGSKKVQENDPKRDETK